MWHSMSQDQHVTVELVKALLGDSPPLLPPTSFLGLRSRCSLFCRSENTVTGKALQSEARRQTVIRDRDVKACPLEDEDSPLSCSLSSFPCYIPTRPTLVSEMRTEVTGQVSWCTPLTQHFRD